jgi:hypothetical protein
MFDQILDNYRRAAETTMQFQQTMLRSWFQQQMPPMFGFPNFPGSQGPAFLEQVHAAQKKWSEGIVAMLNKHREMLDAQYKAGIKAIEDAFKLGEAKDPEHFRKLTEELWKHSFEALKTVTEDQTREFQNAVQKWFELVTQATGAKV